MSNGGFRMFQISFDGGFNDTIRCSIESTSLENLVTRDLQVASSIR